MLTEAQQKLVADNEKLIYYALSKFGYPLDEFYDVGAIGLCKAAKIYNPKKGSFANTAIMQIRSACNGELARAKRHKRPQYPISLETPVKAKGGDSNLTLGDVLPSPSNMVDEAEAMMEATSLLSKLKCSRHISSRDKEIFLKWVTGETQTELSREYGVSRERIRQIISSIKSRCEGLMHDSGAAEPGLWI